MGTWEKRIMSDALLWQILRTNNCFVTKKGEKGDRSDRMRFSKERGNLNGKDSFGNSGLANSKVLSVSMEGKTVKVSNRGKNSSFKPCAMFNQVAGAKKNVKGDPKKIAKLVSKLAMSGRKDLNRAAMARATHYCRTLKDAKPAKAAKTSPRFSKN